jgi:hypothetical protein
MAIGNLRLMDGCGIGLGDFGGFSSDGSALYLWIDVVESMEHFS